MIEITAKFTGEVHTDGEMFDRRVTCEMCKRQRMCAPHFARVRVETAGRVHRYTAAIGLFCRECGAAVEAEIKEAAK